MTTLEQQWTPFLRVCHLLQEQLRVKAEETNLYDDRTAPRETERFRYE